MAHGSVGRGGLARTVRQVGRPWWGHSLVTIGKVARQNQRTKHCFKPTAMVHMHIRNHTGPGLLRARRAAAPHAHLPISDDESRNS